MNTKQNDPRMNCSPLVKLYIKFKTSITVRLSIVGGRLNSPNKVCQVCRIFIGAIVFSLLLAACSGGQKTYTVGVLNTVPDLESIAEGFKQGMAELGYTEGENITYIYEGPASGIAQLDPMAANLVEAKVDLILSITTLASQAAQRATAASGIPVIFVPVTDPVGANLVKSIRQPGGNITGITFGAQEGRRLEWLVQVVPTIEQIYIPYNPDDQSAVLSLETVDAAAAVLGVELITREVHNLEEVTAAMENIPEQVDAIFFLPDSLVSMRIPDLIRTAAELRLPTSGANVGAAYLGVLTAYGFEPASSGKQAARLADQIFKGIKPADLPVETAEFYLVINLKTAEAIGLDISDDALLKADIVVR